MDFSLIEAPSVASPPTQVCQVFKCDDIYVSIGVNHGEGLAGLDDVCLGDIYVLAVNPAAQAMTLQRDAAAQIIAPDSQTGTPGAKVTLAARYTMMAPDGDKLELLALRVDPDAAYFILPLSPMGTNIEYTLVKMDKPQPDERLMDLLCISFARGTLITLGDGSQRPIEELAPGDRVLTRDHGPQAVRWLGNVTLRAVGAYAPVIIPAGVMGNAGDLVVSQHHRMFLYQRKKAGGVPQSELLVQAKHLVDGDRIFLREGGYVDYFSLVFDDHEIIYAESIPAESLMVSEATVSRLPPELAAEVKQRFPGLSQSQNFGIEAGPQAIKAIFQDLAKRGGRGAR